MLFAHLAGALSGAETDCLHCPLTPLAPLEAAAA